MSVTNDIVASWRNPGKATLRHLSRGRSEAFAFALLVVFLILAFVARWPTAARVSALQPEVPVFPQLMAAGLATLATIPVWYGLAALSRLAAGAMGGSGSWYGARIALFWSLVAVSPLVLLTGNPEVMGRFANGRRLRVIAWTVVALIVALNIALLGLTAMGLTLGG